MSCAGEGTQDDEQEIDPLMDPVTATCEATGSAYLLLLMLRFGNPRELNV